MGQLSLGAKMGRVQLGAFGHIEHDLYRNKLSATAAVTMDFVFQEDILKALPQEMGPGMGGLSTDWANDYLLEGLNRLMTPRDRDRFYAASTDDKLPRELRQTLYFDEVDPRLGQEPAGLPQSRGPRGGRGERKLPFTAMWKGCWSCASAEGAMNSRCTLKP